MALTKNVSTTDWCEGMNECNSFWFNLTSKGIVPFQQSLLNNSTLDGVVDINVQVQEGWKSHKTQW